MGTKTGAAKRGGRQEEIPSPRPRPFFHPMRLRVSRNQCDQTISLFGYRILFSHEEANVFYVNEKNEETHHLAPVNGTLSENFTCLKNLGNSSNRQKRYFFTSRFSFYIYIKRERERGRVFLQRDELHGTLIELGTDKRRAAERRRHERTKPISSRDTFSHAAGH